jgi:hypothetical protein
MEEKREKQVVKKMFIKAKGAMAIGRNLTILGAWKCGQQSF